MEWNQAPRVLLPHPGGPGPPLNVLPWDSELPGQAFAHLEQTAKAPSVLGIGRGSPRIGA